jgi:DNA-binding NarL/FixJ family response regulator
MTIRILIADDQQLMRHALCTLLEAEPDLAIAGEAGDPLEMLHLTRQLQPDLVLLDLAICPGNFEELLTTLRRQQPAARIVILTTIEDEEIVVRALRAGASGYLLKSITPYDLVRALRAVAVNGTPLHPRIASRILRRLSHPPEPQPELTAREQEILQLLAQGYTNAEIARKLVINQYTVRSHVCRILKKLNLANRTQAALYLVRRQQEGGWASMPLARSET